VDADQDYLEHAELLSQACASLRGRHPDHTEDLGDRDAAST
jgi:hypothetical protein